MHGPLSDEIETTFHIHCQSASGFPSWAQALASDLPSQALPESVYDTLLLAQSLFHIAASSSPLPIPESLNMAVAAFQAAMKLQPPPVYKPDDREDIEKLQRHTDIIDQELKATREETSRTFLALSAKLDDIAKGFDTQTVRLDITAQAIEEEARKCSTMFEDLSSGIKSIRKDVQSLMLAVDTTELELAVQGEKIEDSELKYVIVDEAEMEIGSDETSKGASKVDVDSPADPCHGTDDSTAKGVMPNTQSTGSSGESTHGVAHQQTIPSVPSIQAPSCPSTVPESGTSGKGMGNAPLGSTSAQKAGGPEANIIFCPKCKEREEKERKEEEKKRQKAERRKEEESGEESREAEKASGGAKEKGGAEKGDGGEVSGNGGVGGNWTHIPAT